jgi:GntR family transcriptional regulator
MIFEIDTTSDIPLWVQLRQRLVHLINNGHYRPGDQLPTVRGLASELSINYNTVNKAYLSMIQDGYLTSTRGRGVFVSAVSEADEELVLEAESLLDELIETFRGLGLSSWEVRKLFAKRLRSLDAARDEVTSDDPSTEKPVRGRRTSATATTAATAAAITTATGRRTPPARSTRRTFSKATTGNEAAAQDSTGTPPADERMAQ